MQPLAGQPTLAPRSVLTRAACLLHKPANPGQQQPTTTTTTIITAMAYECMLVPAPLHQSRVRRAHA